MFSLDLVTVESRSESSVGWITLNRPDALNAWTPELGAELIAAFGHVATDPQVRVVVVTGAGRAFSSGVDLKEVGGASAGDADAGTAGDGIAPGAVSVVREVYNPLLLRVRELAKPVVAAVNGPAAGIGCSLALAADLIIAAESAYFVLPFASVGLGLDGGASATLAGRVGFARAAEMALLGERIPAATAHAWGLVNRVVPDAELGSAAGELAERLATGAPAAHAAIKRTLQDAAYPRFAAALELESALQEDLARSADAREGVTAFLERRQPRFTGA